MDAWSNHEHAMTFKRICAILLALALTLAGISMIRESVKSLQEGEATAKSRRTTRMISREKEPRYFWFIISSHSAMALGLFGVSFWIASASLRPKRPR